MSDSYDELELELVTISEREMYLAQRGLEELPCGCICSTKRPGAPTRLHKACPAIADTHRGYSNAASALTIGSKPEDILSAQKQWNACKKHITASRRWKSTGTPPKSATVKGYGT